MAFQHVLVRLMTQVMHLSLSGWAGVAHPSEESLTGDPVYSIGDGEGSLVNMSWGEMTDSRRG